MPWGSPSPFVLLWALWESWRLSLVFYVNEPLVCGNVFTAPCLSCLFHKPKHFTCLLVLALSVNKGGSPRGALLSADGDSHAEGHLTPRTHSWWGDKVTRELTAHFFPQGSRRREVQTETCTSGRQNIVCGYKPFTALPKARRNTLGDFEVS